MDERAADNGSGWVIVEEVFDIATAKAYEGLFTLGSGYMHVRGSLEEHLSDAPQNRRYTRRPANVTGETFSDRKARWGTYVPGVYGPHPTLNTELVNLPWFLGLAPEVEGERLDLQRSHTESYCRSLDLRRAVLRRDLRWRTAAGPVVDVTFERFISAAQGHVCLQRLTIQADRAAKAIIRSGIDADVCTNGHDHFREVRMTRANAGEVRCHVYTDGDEEVGVASRLYCGSARWRYESGGRRGEVVAGFDLGPSDRLVIEKRTAVSTGRDLIRRDAHLYLDKIESLSWERLLAEHVEEWGRRWDACEVRIEGDAGSQLAVRAAVFHLLRAHVPGDSRVAIDAKGYSGEAYWGRFFWDTELFLLPFYLYTDPARAKTLLDFRLNTLEGARQNARLYGYDGARYAWESDPAGRECCPNWQYADHEVHVTADVVHGLAHYAAATKQAEWLNGPAASAIVETARYWLQRIDRREDGSGISLMGVMGPDEYTPISNDNAYTNRMVAFCLNLAAGNSESGEAGECFARAAANLPILRHPDDPNLILQCEGFHRLADPRFEDFWRDRRRPFSAQVSQERLYRSRCLKQADVLMMMMLFPDEFTDEEVRCAWDYYLPLTTHDSSLSAGVHAIVASRLGLQEEAWRFWRKATGIDLDVGAGGAAEGIHIACAGAIWQAVTIGFAGMRTAIQCETLTLDPRLPREWHRLTFPLIWRGCPVLVDIRPDQVVVNNRSEASAITVCVRGETRTVPPGCSSGWDLQPGACAVIFDLDGVLVTTDKLHYQSWKELTEAEGIPFDATVNEQLRGVSRMDSLAIILREAGRDFPETVKQEFAERKNLRYRQLLESLTRADLAPGAIGLVESLRKSGVRTALASSSRNARLILERLGITDWFDAIVDGNDISVSKPDPDVFLKAAGRLGVPAGRCVVVEDAEAGVEAAFRAGMAVAGVGSAAGSGGLAVSGADLSAISGAELIRAACSGRGRVNPDS